MPKDGESEHGTRRKREANKTVRLQAAKHKFYVRSRSGERIKVHYRRFRDKRGRLRHELIGPFDLTQEQPRS